MGVSVSPDGATELHPENTGPYLVSFNVQNTGNTSASFTFTCSQTGGLTCGSVTPTSASIATGALREVDVQYSVGATGGQVKLTANGGATDQGYYVVTAGNPPPAVSLAPHNPVYRDVSKCVATCFDAVYSHSTPPYFSLGAGRSLTLVYNSSTAHPTPVVFVDVSNTQTPYPTTYDLQVQLISNGAFLTLANGSQRVYYTAGTNQTTRLAAVIDALANGLTTGAYDVNVTVRSNYVVGSSASTTVPTRILVDDESQSPFGTGVSVIGLQRVYPLSGTSAAVVTEGGGSVAFYDRACSTTCPFITPAGASASLSYNSGNQTYRRTSLDSSYVEFNSTGRMTKAADRFGNLTQLTWTGSLLTSITDPMNKVTTLCYGGGACSSGTLQSVTDPTTPVHRTTTYTLNASNQLVRITDPDGYSDSLGYTTAGLLTTSWDRARQPSDYTYDALNRLNTILAPTITTYTGASVRPTVTLTPAERVVWQPALAGTSASNAKAAVRPDTIRATISDPLSRTSRLALDRFGAPTMITDPYGATTTLVRDTASRPTLVTAPNGHITRATFTGYLLTQAKDSTSGQTVSYTYNGRNDVTTVSSGTLPRQDFFYYTGTDGGPAGALKTVYVGNTAVYPALASATLLATHKPDALGRDTVVLDAANHAMRLTYSTTWGNLLRTKNAAGRVDSLHFDGAGRPDTSWTPTVGKTSVSYGTLNQVLSEAGPYGYSVQHQYNPATLLLEQLLDAKGQVYKFAYNPLGALVAQHDLADTTKADTLKYDEAGQVRSMRTRRGDVLSLTYDAMGRLLTRSGPDFPADSFRYDPNGRWVVGVNAYAYDSVTVDSAGRPKATIQRVHGRTISSTYSYDTQGRLQQMTLASSGSDSLLYKATTLYRYNTATGTLDTICAEANCRAVRRSADLRDSVVTYRPSSGTSWSVTDSLSPTHEVLKQGFPSPLTNFGSTLVRDSLDRIARRVKYPGIKKYSYDQLGRLTNACDSVSSVAGCSNQYGLGGSAYAYDSAGNRTDAGAVILAGNRTRVFRGDTLTYDSNGNVILRASAVSTTGYGWDALSRLNQVTQGGAFVASFRYDAFGRRVLKVTAADSLWFIYDAGSQVQLDMSANGATTVVKTKYYYEPGVDNLLAVTQATPAFSAVAITDPDIGTLRGLAKWDGGTLIKSYLGTLSVQTPWGGAPADTGVVVRFRAAGREYDQETGLYYNRARYYDPKLGRFLSEDPIGIDGGLNLYAYAGNDPVNGFDPSGLGRKKGTNNDPDGAGGMSGGAYELAEIEVVGDYTVPLTVPLGPLRGNPYYPPFAFGFAGGGGGGSGGGGGGAGSTTGRRPKPSQVAPAVDAEAAVAACRAAILETTASVAIDIASFGLGRLAARAGSEGIRLIGLGRLLSESGLYARVGREYFIAGFGAQADAAMYRAARSQVTALGGASGAAFGAVSGSPDIRDFVPILGSGRALVRAYDACNPS